MYRPQINYIKNEAERYKLYQKMDQLIMDYAPIVPLFYDESVNLYQNNISGLSSNAQNLLILKNVKKIKKELKSSFQWLMK